MKAIARESKTNAFPPLFADFLSFERQVFGEPSPIAVYDPFLIRYGEYRFILDVVRPKLGDTVVDLGCEANLLMLFLGSRGANVTGIDVDADLVELVHERKQLVYRATGIDPAVRFEVQDATELDLESDSADFVIATSRSSTCSRVAETATSLQSRGSPARFAQAALQRSRSR